MLFANGVNLNDSLRTPLQGINKKSQGNLQDALGRISARQTTSNAVSGRPQGEYAPAELQRSGTQASGDIESQLLQALGGASYDEQQKQKEQDSNIALARQIGSINSPNSAQELLAALGSVGSIAGTGYGLYKNRPRDTSTPNAPGTLPPSLSLYGNGSGYGRYQ